MNGLKSEPLVSVLTTVYNREKYLSESIESVLSSTYSNFELIIVDDCSTDNSVRIARKYESTDDRIRVHVNDKNLGDYPNRNVAASYACGKYIKYLDADDKINPEGLEMMVSIMSQFPEAALGLFSHEEKAKLLSPKEAYESYYLLGQGHFDRSPLSTIINRELFNKCGGFSGKRMVGDFEMWHILARRYDIILLPGFWGWYRVHDEQEMTQGRLNLMYRLEYLKISENALTHPDCPMCVEDRTKSIKKIARMKSRLVFSALKKLKFLKAIELYNAIQFDFLQLINHAMRPVH